jgi:5'-3' exonuclease
VATSSTGDVDARRHYVIVSDDSDLVLIGSLQCKHTWIQVLMNAGAHSRLYAGLCMASMHRVDISVVSSSHLASRDDFERFSTAACFDRLRRSFPHDPPDRVAVDFVFLILLTGNDYLPCLDKYFVSPSRVHTCERCAS